MTLINNVLCPVDFFPGSRTALKYAASVSRKYGALLHILHVVPIPVSTTYAASLEAPSHEAREVAAVREMAKLEKETTSTGVRVETSLRAGEIEREINSAVASVGADLVVMGTHGRRGFERWFLGSVTERMLRRSSVPILTTSDVGDGSRPLEHVRNVLVTTDFSGGTEVPISYARSMSEGSSATVTLLHVTSHSQEVDREAIMVQLNGLVPPDASNLACRVEKGDPYRKILDVIDAESVDLVVMNIHGKGMLERALVGATAERVIRAATCPVLGIPSLAL